MTTPLTIRRIEATLTKTPADVWLEGYEEGLGLRPPRSSGNPYRPDGVPEAVQLYADAQALADVRTLDDWAKFHRDYAPAPRPYAPASGGWFIQLAPFKAFDGSTPDEARAKAAAWVREQSATPPGESK